jgi:hypothetical protein
MEKGEDIENKVKGEELEFKKERNEVKGGE